MDLFFHLFPKNEKNDVWHMVIEDNKNEKQAQK
jgi:hypothetical protein